ncbi:MAG TPA: DUF5916 domain-containing protein, partial [Longimicrobium sp.]
RWSANANAWNGWSFGGERLTTGVNVNGNATLHSNWMLLYSADTELRSLRTDALRGGPAIVAPAYSAFTGGIFSDDRRVVSGRLVGGGWREWETGGGGWNASAYVAIRPSSRVRLSLGPDFSRGTDPWAYVATATETDGGTPHYVFGRLRQSTAALTARLDYAFTPRLTLEFYAQPFVATGGYDAFREVADPRAARFGDRFRAYGDELRLADGVYAVEGGAGDEPAYTWRQPDFNLKELRSNLVVRWEYRPGSTLFLVWSQGRQNLDGPGTFQLARDFGRLLDEDRSPSTHVLLLKMSYWLDL